MTNFTKFKFCKDQWGVHVYYTGLDGNPNEIIRDLMINTKVEFDCSQTCVVPPVKMVSTINKETGIETEHSFEVIDIEYPADERLVPMRHLIEARINYFSVDGKAVAVNMLNILCQDAGLTKVRGGGAREYWMSDYSGEFPHLIKIEGMHCGKPFDEMKLSGHFTGHMQECREYINDLESKARDAVDIWLLDGKTSKGFTVRFLLDHLNTIHSYVYSIQAKIKTKNNHEWALEHISRMINEIKVIGMQELMDDEENSDDELDNGSL